MQSLRKPVLALLWLTVAGMLVFGFLAVSKLALPQGLSARLLLASVVAFAAVFHVWVLGVVPRGERQPVIALSLSTLAFTIAFMCWTMNGVLVTYLVDNSLFDWTDSQIGTLLGIPILTGSLTRLPVGIWTDKYGGKKVFAAVMLVSAVPLFFVSRANSYGAFWWLSLAYGLVGASFAVGIAYCSIWFGKEQQGTALGIFGAGNAGASLTSMGAPYLLRYVTGDGANPDQWRLLPQIYAVILLLMGLAFLIFAPHRKFDDSGITTLAQRLEPLRHMRVWRFGLYYFLVFGGFVALSTWLVPYYVSVYGVSLVVAGNLAAVYSLPSGVIRAVGGWMSDKWGARTVMYWVLGACLVCCAVLSFPRMTVEMPGKSVRAARKGTVEAVSPDTVVVSGRTYAVTRRAAVPLEERVSSLQFWPSREVWQEPVVAAGDQVAKKNQLLARGVTRIFFPANIWMFTVLIFLVGFWMGIGKAAVYKHIPTYFPHQVGVVGGIVGVIGGLGGWIGPVIFGRLLDWSGIWTTCWIFFAGVSVICLVWMHLVIQHMHRSASPQLAQRIERGQGGAPTESPLPEGH